MLSRSEISEKLSEYLTDMFEVPPETIHPEAHLYEDLDLDSIDAIDLVAKLQDLTGRKILPTDFKTVETVNDVIDRIHELVSE